MKKLVIVTSTRAEYGLLRPIMKRLISENEIEVLVAVTGAHLDRSLGYTVDEIREDEIPIDVEIPILVDGDTPEAISQIQANALLGFGQYFGRVKPDAVMVLGDRYETLSICLAAVNACIPIIHLHGGEATLGAIDEMVRNAITKMSYLHFASTEEYRKRIIQMGEEPDRVYNTGAIGVENVLKTDFMTLHELEESLDCELTNNYALLTFHPVTTEPAEVERQLIEVLSAMEVYPNFKILCTKANADAGGKRINQLLTEYASDHKNFILRDSLGVRRYLSAVKYAKFVYGNSSSGILEVPSFHIPTINIGDRQKGRIQADSVLNCPPVRAHIRVAVRRALDPDFRKSLVNVKNPYEGYETCKTICRVTRDYLINDRLKVQKPFYNIFGEIDIDEDI